MKRHRREKAIPHSPFVLALLVGGLSCPSFAPAQNATPIPPTAAVDSPRSTFESSCPLFVAPTAIRAAQPAPLPRMSSERALQVYQQKVEEQARTLASYSVTTVIRAGLPSMSQYGEYELRSDYLAPRTLGFRVIQSTGDPFVKTNVIVRLLRSEVDHAQKDDPALTSLTPVNYRFFPKSTTTLDGRSVYIYEVKPLAKRLGLFKGRIYLDGFTGSLVRAEGRIVKSPSVFIKGIRFAREYVDVAGFTQAARRDAPPLAQWMNFACPEFSRAQHCRTHHMHTNPTLGVRLQRVNEFRSRRLDNLFLGSRVAKRLSFPKWQC